MVLLGGVRKAKQIQSRFKGFRRDFFSTYLCGKISNTDEKLGVKLGGVKKALLFTFFDHKSKTSMKTAF